MEKSTRREFARKVGTVMAAAAAIDVAMGSAGLPVHPFGSPGKVSPLTAGKTFVGIQMSPHTMLDEGVDECLDLIGGKAGVNAVFPYSHAFHTSTLGKPLRDLATDHGKMPRDFRNKVPGVWVRHKSSGMLL